MRSILALSAAAAVLLQQVLADSVPLTDSFTTFRWNGNDALAQETFTINLDKPARIQITDYKNVGDSFKVYDNEELLGETSKVETSEDEEVYASTPEEALDDDRYSKGTFDLAAGEHTISIKASGPYEAGTAAIRLIEDPSQSFQKKKSWGGKGDYDDYDDDWKGGKGDYDDYDNDWKGGKGDYDDYDDDWKGGKGGKGWDYDDDWEGGWGDDWEGGWGGKGDYGKGGYGKGDKKWHDQHAPWGGLDTSHTITLTKTEWFFEKPTIVPAFPFAPPLVEDVPDFIDGDLVDGDLIDGEIIYGNIDDGILEEPFAA